MNIYHGEHNSEASKNGKNNVENDIRQGVDSEPCHARKEYSVCWTTHLK